MGIFSERIFQLFSKAIRINLDFIPNFSKMSSSQSIPSYSTIFPSPLPLPPSRSHLPPNKLPYLRQTHHFPPRQHQISPKIFLDLPRAFKHSQ